MSGGARARASWAVTTALCDSGKDPYAIVKKQTAAATQEAVNSGVKLVRPQKTLALMTPPSLVGRGREVGGGARFSVRRERNTVVTIGERRLDPPCCRAF